MNTFTTIIQGELLSKFIKIPKEWENVSLEIVVNPIKTRAIEKKVRSIAGSLSEYKNIENIPKESLIWDMVISDKYAHT